MPQEIVMEPSADGKFEPVSINDSKRTGKKRKSPPKAGKEKENGSDTEKVKAKRYSSQAYAQPSSPVSDMLAGVKIGVSLFNQIRKVVR